MAVEVSKNGNQTEENTKNIAVMSNDLGYIKKSVDAINNKIDSMMKNVPTRSEFKALQDQVEAHQAIFIWVGRLIVGGVIVALLGLVLNSQII